MHASKLNIDLLTTYLVNVLSILIQGIKSERNGAIERCECRISIASMLLLFSTQNNVSLLCYAKIERKPHLKVSKTTSVSVLIGSQRLHAEWLASRSMR